MKQISLSVFLALVLLRVSCVFAQESGPIEDNSFLIEEAYNQEAGVVQHISNYMSFPSPTGGAYSFCQEWPLFSIKHQLSFTVPVLFPQGAHGIGDMWINYRYQLFGKDSWAAVSPRFSLLLPTGSQSKGLGDGQFGFQVALPVSKELSKQFITHWNLGTTVLPGVEGSAGKKTLNSPFAGASLIWLTKPNFNLMLEYLAAFPAELDQHGRVNHTTDQIVSPGFRFAINHGGLQVVPGVGVPVHFADGKTSTGIFLYLSFEHPF